jgi:histidine triad (HIT) family protein
MPAIRCTPAARAAANRVARRVNSATEDRGVRSGATMTDSNDCIFCRIVAGELPAEIVHEDETTIAFLDINPATRGHAVVIPRVHAADIHDVPPDDFVACTRAAQRLARRAIDRLGAEGVNVFHSTGEAASQVVFHFHLHVIPRYPDDGLRNPLAHGRGEPADIAAVAAQLMKA